MTTKLLNNTKQDIATAGKLLKDGELVKLLEMMLEQNMLPTPIESVTNSFWLISFVGSITSALTALLAQRRISPRM